MRLIAIGGVAAGGLALALIVGAVVRRVATLGRLSERTRRPFRSLAAVAGIGLGLAWFAPPGQWAAGRHLATLLIIAAAGWLLTSLLLALEDSALPRLRVDVRDNRHARAVRTQLTVLRRVTVVAVAILTLGASLMTFQGVRLIGTSVLASAGVLAAIAGFATNALLGNVVAGLQIAFSGSLRLDDVVVVEGEWGRVEEVTLTYVVVHIWDDRRLILPSSYFTTRPFENWTHTGSELTGEVLLDVDFTVDLAALRTTVQSLVDSDERWDRRVCVTQVVGAVGGQVTVRALVSAVDAPTLWDLRCAVREGLVNWVRQESARPRTRMEFGPGPAGPVPDPADLARLAPRQNSH